jgi:hypothetical protein
MRYKDLSTGDIFAVLSPGRSPLFRKTFEGRVDEVRGGDSTGMIISRPTKVVIQPEQEVQLIEQTAITGKPTH